jgi:glycosylphosphatidylinositol transamidase (GPIT) subunit GPI8
MVDLFLDEGIPLRVFFRNFLDPALKEIHTTIDDAKLFNTNALGPFWFISSLANSIKGLEEDTLDKLDITINDFFTNKRDMMNGEKDVGREWEAHYENHIISSGIETEAYVHISMNHMKPACPYVRLADGE